MSSLVYDTAFGQRGTCCPSGRGLHLLNIGPMPEPIIAAVISVAVSWGWSWQASNLLVVDGLKGLSSLMSAQFSV